MSKEFDKRQTAPDKYAKVWAVISLLAIVDPRTDAVPELNVCRFPIQSGNFYVDNENKRQNQDANYRYLPAPLDYGLEQIPDSKDFLNNLIPDSISRVENTIITDFKKNKHRESIEASNVILSINTTDLKKRYNCNGVHIGKGKIATAAHCFSKYIPSELSVTIMDSNGNEHIGKSITRTKGLDAAVVSTDSMPYPGQTEIEGITDIKQSQLILVYSRIKDNKSYNAAIFAGGGKLTKSYNCTTNNTFYEFGMLTDKGNYVGGHSGGGIYNPDNGKLIGIISAVSSYAIGNTAFVVGTRSELVKELEKYAD